MTELRRISSYVLWALAIVSGLAAAALVLMYVQSENERQAGARSHDIYNPLVVTADRIEVQATELALAVNDLLAAAELSPGPDRIQSAITRFNDETARHFSGLEQNLTRIDRLLKTMPDTRLVPTLERSRAAFSRLVEWRDRINQGNWTPAQAAPLRPAMSVFIDRIYQMRKLFLVEHQNQMVRESALRQRNRRNQQILLAIVLALGTASIIYFTRNITGLVSVHENLRRSLKASEAKLRRAQRLAHLGQWELDLATDRLEWSDETFEIFGVNPASFSGHQRDFLAILHDDDRKGVRDRLTRVVESEGAFSSEYRIFRANDGALRYIRGWAEVVRDTDGNPVRVIGTLQDVTDSEQAKIELQEREARLRTAERVARIGHWEWNAKTDRILWSNQMYEIFGLDPDHFSGTREFVIDRIHPEDRAHVRARVDAVISTGAPATYEYRIIRADGEVRHVQAFTEVVERRRSGAPLRVTGTIQDITESHAAKLALEASEASLRNAQRIARIGNWDWDIVTNELRWSDQIYSIFGLSKEGFQETFDAFLEAVHPDDRALVQAAVDQALEHGKSYSVEHRIVRPDGEIRVVHEQGEIDRDLYGNALRMSGTVQDITESHEVKKALEAREAELRLITDHLPVLIAYVDRDGYYRFANRVCCKWYGRPRDEIVGAHMSDLLDEERCALMDTALTGQRVTTERKFPYGDGEMRDVIADLIPHVSEDGEVIGAFILTTDITEYRKTATLTERFGQIIERSINEIYIIDGETLKFTHANRGARQNLGYSMDELRQLTPVDIKPDFTAEKFEELIRPLRDGTRDQVVFETVHQRKDGSVYDVEVRLQFSREETPPIFVAIIQDITERRRADEALRRSEQNFRDLVDRASQGILIHRRGRVIYANRAAAEILGYALTELIGMPLTTFVPEDQRIDLNKALEQGHFGPFESKGLRKDGTLVPVDVGLSRIVWDGAMAGQIIITDISTRKEAEEKLRHAQRMDAVGQLTGGLAHDFNNLLAIVIGNLDILLEKIADQPELLSLGTTARHAATRGADLTRRLLAFARQQPLNPVTVDLNERVSAIIELFERSLGKSIHIKAELCPDPWPVTVDIGEFETTLLNLAINAQQAMPQGGEIVLRTANVEIDEEFSVRERIVTPGRYVLVTVSDTGMGMTPEVLDQALEPFFTTKDVGEGTGLGLSTVYGFVSQSGGFMDIKSTPGQGTAVELYFPTAAPKCEPDHRLPARDDGTAATPGQRVLVVEDEPAVRQLAVLMVRELGYEVTAAADADEALAILKSPQRIDLLYTDIMLSGDINGCELALGATKLCPGLKVLYTTGYVEKAVSLKARLNRDEDIVLKPCSKSELAQHLARLLSPEPRARTSRSRPPGGKGGRKSTKRASHSVP